MAFSTEEEADILREASARVIDLTRAGYPVGVNLTCVFVTRLVEAVVGARLIRDLVDRGAPGDREMALQLLGALHETLITSLPERADCLLNETYRLKPVNEDSDDE